MDEMQEPLIPLPEGSDSHASIGRSSARTSRRAASSATAAAPSPDDLSGTLDRPSFVIQKHSGRGTHYDFRLEANGVLVSWALPKGIPTGAQNRLAIQTEDHPLSYATFEGDIEVPGHAPAHVETWEYGVYQIHEWQDAKILVTLYPETDTGGLRGQQLTVAILHTGRPDPQDWLMRRARAKRSSEAHQHKVQKSTNR